MTSERDRDASDTELALIVAVLDGGGVIPIDLRARAHALSVISEYLIARGWLLRDIDAQGLSFSWPPSLTDRPERAPRTETPVTWLTLLSGGASIGQYLLAGQLQGEPSHGLWWSDGADLTDQLDRIEAYRYSGGSENEPD